MRPAALGTTIWPFRTHDPVGLPRTMKIVLNGEEKQLNAPLTVAGLLCEIGYADRRVAVEINREIVPRSRYPEHQLQDNDRVEVVLAIGGG